MRDEVPAALPLIAFAACLAIGPWLVNATLAAAGLAIICGLVVTRHTRVVVIAALAAAGVMIGAADARRRANERAMLAALDSDRFVTIVAPLERDWSARPHVFVLRASRFRAADIDVRAPLAVYARFPPPPIGMEAVLRAEGHLRSDRRGGYTMSLKSARLMSYDGELSRWSPAAWNRMIANRLRSHAAARPHEIAMTEALLLGRGERLSDATKEDFKRGGTYHLLVFSGLQISVAAGVIAMMLRWAGAARAADWSLLIFAIVAPMFIGNEASVSRASIAIGLYALTRTFKRPTTFENLWCVAAIVRLIVVPSDLYDPAFHLTYAGAAALLFVGRPLAQSRLRWLGYVVAAELAIVPLTLFHFHQYALGGSLMTILMTPVVFVMLIAGGLFAATEISLLLDLIAALNALCDVMNQMASPLSGFFGAPPAWSLVGGFVAALAAVGVVKGRSRTTAVVLALVLPSAAAVVLVRSRTTVDEPRLTVLDVGQGDALLLRSGARSLLVDGGGRHDDLRFGESVLLPLLLDRGVRSLDAIILTHAHPDHCGGLAAAIRHLDVASLWISPRRFRGECAHLLLEAAQWKGIPIRLIRGGETIELGEIKAQLIVATTRFRRAPENNHSVVIAATTRERRILLTGDIERDAERHLAPHLGPADVLKVPHHGSKTSTSSVLLDVVRPRLAVISCGFRNFFGHPHPSVLQTLNERSVRVVRTDLNGSIDIVFGQKHMGVHREIDTPR